MGHKDIISKNIFKRILKDIATYIFKLELTHVELIETEQQRIEDRRADLTARVVDSTGKTFILHLEIQNQNQEIMPDRMLRYLSDIRLKYKDEDVHQYLLYIGKKPLTMASGIKTLQLDYQYSVIDMHKIDYQFFMQKNTADALVLAVLGDFKDAEAKSVIHEILTRLITITKGDHKALREYISMLEVLASNRDINLDIQQEFEMLEIEIEKLPSFLIGEKLGEKRGEKRGEQNKALLIAKQLLKLNLSMEKISEVTGVTISVLENLSIDNKTN